MTCSCDIAVPGWAEDAARDPLGPRNKQLSGLGTWRFMAGRDGGGVKCGRAGGGCLVGVGVDGPLRLIGRAWRWARIRSRSAISARDVE